MRISKKKSKKIVLKLILLFFIAYVIFLFINQQIKIKNKNDELAQINKQITTEKSKNEEIRNKINESGNNKNSDKSNSGKRVFENSTE